MIIYEMEGHHMTTSARNATVSLAEIVIPDTCRVTNAHAVVELASSIERLGLQNAPTCVEREGKLVLVAGRHRIEALRVLNIDSVQVRIAGFDDIEARLWSISENIHRSELSATQRSEQIAEYARLVKERRELIPAQLAQKSKSDSNPRGAGRHEEGDSLAARELGITRDDVRRAEQIASLSPEAKRTARDHGLDDNQSALLAAAKGKTADRQVAVLKDVADRGRVASAESAKPLRNLENISGGELARWIKATTPNDRRHVIRVLETATAILSDELKTEEGLNGPHDKAFA